jgi:transcriptional regulator with XRE-family HTH domain
MPLRNLNPRASAAQLIAARELLGWSRDAITEKIGVVVGSIRDVENGRGSEVNAARLIALYEAVGVEFLPGGLVRKKQQ